MSVERPHFALPFRFTAGAAVVNEQDSVDEIEDCVLAIASYPIGSRIEKPAFGIPDQTFRQGGADPAVIAAAVNQWEPRAAALASVDNTSLAARLSRVTISTKETA